MVRRIGPAIAMAVLSGLPVERFKQAVVEGQSQLSALGTQLVSNTLGSPAADAVAVLPPPIR